MHLLHLRHAGTFRPPMFPVKHQPQPEVETLIKINLLDFDPDLRRRFVTLVKAKRLLS